MSGERTTFPIGARLQARERTSLYVVGETPDYCCEPGAERLKAMIEAYWRERGFDVRVTVRPAGFHPSVRAIRFEVHSDMLNGLPRRASAAAPR